jgi:hypothetical protein
VAKALMQKVGEPGRSIGMSAGVKQIDYCCHSYQQNTALHTASPPRRKH